MQQLSILQIARNIRKSRIERIEIQSNFLQFALTPSGNYQFGS